MAYSPGPLAEHYILDPVPTLLDSVAPTKPRFLRGIVTEVEFAEQTADEPGNIQMGITYGTPLHSVLWAVSGLEPTLPVTDKPVIYKGSTYLVGGSFTWDPHPDPRFQSLEGFMYQVGDGHEDPEASKKLELILALAMGESVMKILNVNPWETSYKFGVSHGPTEVAGKSPTMTLAQHAIRWQL